MNENCKSLSGRCDPALEVLTTRPDTVQFGMYRTRRPDMLEYCIVNLDTRNQQRSCPCSSCHAESQFFRGVPLALFDVPQGSL